LTILADIVKPPAPRLGTHRDVPSNVRRLSVARLTTAGAHR